MKMATTMLVLLSLANVFFTLSLACSMAGNVAQCAEFYGAKMLSDKIEKAQLHDDFYAAGGNHTLFAPTDGAFAKLPSAVQEALDKDISLLKDVLLYHLLPVALPDASLKNDEVFQSSSEDNKVRINVYSFPDSAEIATASGSKLLTEGDMTTNGILYMVDTVMYPLPVASTYDYIVNDDNLSSFLLTMLKAELSDLFKDGPYTLFAPNNMAFSSLPPGTLSNLINNATEAKRVLEGHVVKGTYYSAGLYSGKKLSTLQGTELDVKISGGVVVNDAKVTMGNVTTATGVVHIIDKVLMP